MRLLNSVLLGISFFTLSFYEPSEAKSIKIPEYILLIDGSRILNSNIEFQFLDLLQFGAPALAVKERKSKMLHYFMTEIRYPDKRTPAGFCSGKMISKTVCVLNPFPNSVVLAKESTHQTGNEVRYIHTLLVDKKISHDEAELKRLARFMDSIL